jgi:predicted lipid-binding transport protein (Tim44 family)
MKFAKFFALLFATGALVLGEAEAKRLGGGGSIGKQSQGVSQRQATPPQQNAAPAQQPSQAQPAAAPNPAGAAQPARNRWLGPVAGLAAGLGLAALASHLGFGEELASFMLIALLAIAAIVVVRMVMARRAQPPRPAFAGGGYPQTGIGSEAAVNYSPLPQAPGGSRAPSAPVVGPSAASQPADGGLRIPPGFDSDGFLRNAKVQFVRLQAAFDAADSADLREFTSPQMFAELKVQIDERAGAKNVTEVVQLDAQLLGIESGPVEHMASVRFHGLIREEEGAAAQPFDEVWNLTKPVSGGGGWVLAGIQQLN